jgi:hypothetical protein
MATVVMGFFEFQSKQTSQVEEIIFGHHHSQDAPCLKGLSNALEIPNMFKHFSKQNDIQRPRFKAGMKSISLDHWKNMFLRNGDVLGLDIQTQN